MVEHLLERLAGDRTVLSQEAADTIRQLRRRATNAEYMMIAYYKMLGPIGRQVADNWRNNNVDRVHHNWNDSQQLSGEEFAREILEVETYAQTLVDNID